MAGENNIWKECTSVFFFFSLARAKEVTKEEEAAAGEGEGEERRFCDAELP